MPAPGARSEALKAGLKWYFTGKPCRRGHVAQRLTSDGGCRECSREDAKQAYWKNPEKYRASSRAWGSAHLERKRLKLAKRRKENPEKFRTAFREWCSRNRERMRAHARKNYRKRKPQVLAYLKRWCVANPDKRREYSARLRKKRPETYRAHVRNRCASIRQIGGQHTGADVAAILTAQRNRCAYCRIKLKLKYHVDHIVSLAQGGSNDRSNIQITCGPCNLAKHAKDPIQFAQSLGLLL